jgi:hypothetical protein
MGFIIAIIMRMLGPSVGFRQSFIIIITTTKVQKITTLHRLH